MRAVRVALALGLVTAGVTGCTAMSVSAADLPVGNGVNGVSGVNGTAAPGDAPLSQLAAPSTALSVPAAAPSVVVIGDSIMDGHGITPEQAWPELVASSYGWQLTNLSSDGTGLVTPGDDGETYDAQGVAAASLQPAVVVVSASSNDLDDDPTEVSDAATAFFQNLRVDLPDTRIIAVSAFWGDTEVPDDMTQIDDQVQSAATAVGAEYVDLGQPLAGHPELMQDDDVHPTADGQQLIADSYGPQLEALIGYAP